MTEARAIPSVSVTYAGNGSSTRANALGMRPMQERAYEKRGEQYLLIKSPPASGKSRALRDAHGYLIDGRPMAAVTAVATHKWSERDWFTRWIRSHLRVVEPHRHAATV